MKPSAALLLLSLLAPGNAAVLPSGTLAECKYIAGWFNSTCTEAPDNAAASVAAMQSETVTCDNVGACAGTCLGTVSAGACSGTCSWERRLCVSCSESAGVVRIRVQSNGLPTHCYTSPKIALASIDVDFSAVFSPGVDPAVPSSAANSPATQDAVSDLICDIGRHKDSPAGKSLVPSASSFTKHGTTGTNAIAGVAISGVSMMNQMSIELVDPFYPKTWSTAATTVASYTDAPEKVDKCIAHPQGAGIFHYHMMPPCLFNKAIQDQGNSPIGGDDAKARAYLGYEAAAGMVVVGVLKDGNVVWGPYDSCGAKFEGWDVCNGMEMVWPTGGKHYSYVASETFPYFSGCFGPGNRPSFTPGCSANTVPAYTAIVNNCNVPSASPSAAPVGPTASPAAAPPPTAAPQAPTAGPAPPGPTKSPVPNPTGAPRAPPAAGSKPNILLFHPDDMYLAYSADWAAFAPKVPPLETMPSGTGISPRMDQIRAEGMQFNRAYAASGMCSPSRYALLTGRYPSRCVFAEAKTKKTQGAGTMTKVTVPWSSIIEEDKTHNAATALRDCGYRTGAIGKWHLTPDDETGAAYADAYSTQQQRVYERGFDYADGIYVSNLNNCGTPCAGFSHNMEWLTYKAMEFMSQSLASSTPFFLYYNPTPPHSPLSKECLKDGTFTELNTPNGDLPSAPDYSQFCTTCTKADRLTIWDATRAFTGLDRSMVAGTKWVDESAGVLYDFLKEKSVLDNTVYVVLSDNGHSKGSVMELGTRVPMWVRYGKVPAGQTNELVLNVDIVPTLLELAGGGVGTYDTNGVSLADLLQGNTASLGRTEIFLEMSYDRAVVTSQYKYIRAGQGAFANDEAEANVRGWYPAWGVADQLYDLSVDEDEQSNKAGTLASTLSALSAKMDAHLAAMANNPTPGTGSPVCAADPTMSPSAGPAVAPSASPSAAPSRSPSGGPSSTPTTSPQPAPTKHPLKPASPTESPQRPTTSPSKPPTASPQAAPTAPPSSAPQPAPTKHPLKPASPTESPKVPTAPPSQPPSASPQAAPTAPPQAAPTMPPQPAPTKHPLKQSSPTESPKVPTAPPSQPPSASPQAAPTAAPQAAPTMPPQPAPTKHPLKQSSPTESPKVPTAPPSQPPSASPQATPTRAPSASPRPAPTKAPLKPASPTQSPLQPTASPQRTPTSSPQPAPTKGPLKAASPTQSPLRPTASPQRSPTAGPRAAPTKGPLKAASPTQSPLQPTASPQRQPTKGPLTRASPTESPRQPTRAPRAAPTKEPLQPGSPTQPPARPTAAPAAPPTKAPLKPGSPTQSPAAPGSPTQSPAAPLPTAPPAAPTRAPTAQPSAAPQVAPTAAPTPPGATPAPVRAYDECTDVADPCLARSPASGTPEPLCVDPAKFATQLGDFYCECANGALGADGKAKRVVGGAAVCFVDECAGPSSPCGDGQTCKDPDTRADKENDFVCTCDTPAAGSGGVRSSYVGTRARCEVDECAAGDVCGEGQTCADPNRTAASASQSPAASGYRDYVCTCNAGGASAEGRPADCGTSGACAGSPCGDGQRCAERSGGYVCSCDPPFFGTGVNARASCQSDECSAGSDLCPAGQECVDADSRNTGTYVCRCLPPFQGSAVGKAAQCAYDDCADDPCSKAKGPFQRCTDVGPGRGEFTCSCKNGERASNKPARCRLDECDQRPGAADGCDSCEDPDTTPSAVSDYVCVCNGEPVTGLSCVKAAALGERTAPVDGEDETDPLLPILITLTGVALCGVVGMYVVRQRQSQQQQQQPTFNDFGRVATIELQDVSVPRPHSGSQYEQFGGSQGRSSRGGSVPPESARGSFQAQVSPVYGHTHRI